MQFDSSAEAQQQVRRSLSLDPRMVRFSVVKIGDKLGGKKGSIETVSGEISWRAPRSDVAASAFNKRHINNKYATGR